MDAHRIAEKHHLIGPVVEQPQYNMLVRNKVEVEYQDVYRTVGLGTTIWSPLASGILTGKYNGKAASDVRLKRDELSWLADLLLTEETLDKVTLLMELARELDMTAAQLAIGWCLGNPNVSTVLLGASKEAQLVENRATLDHRHKLTPEVRARIEDILDNQPQQPQY